MTPLKHPPGILRISLIMVLVGVTVFGCKKPPTFSSPNSYDPYSSNFIPVKPSNLSVNSTDDQITVSWKVPAGQLNAISGFKVYRSEKDSLNYQFFESVERNTSGTSFHISHQRNNDVFNYLYKVQSFFIQTQDTVFSEPVYAKITFLPEHNVEYYKHPFLEEPYQTFHYWIDENESASLNIYKKISPENFEKILTIKNPSDGTMKYPLDVLKAQEVFYYTLSRNGYESDFFPIQVDYQDQYFPFLIKIVNISSASFSIHLTDLMGVDLKNSSSNEEIFFSSFSILIIDSDSSEIYKNLDLPEFNSINVTADSTKKYSIQISGKNGAYETDEVIRMVLYKPVQIDKNSISTPTVFTDNYYATIHPSKPWMLYSSIEKNSTTIINFLNGSKHLVSNQSTVAKFTPSYFESDGDYISVDNSYLTLWKIDEANQLTSTQKIPIYDAPYRLHVLDFDFYSENELIILNGTSTNSPYHLAIYNLTTQQYTKSFAISGHGNLSHRIQYDRSSKTLYHIFKYDDWGYTYLRATDLNDNTPIYIQEINIFDDYVNLEANDNYSHLILAGDDSYQIIDSSNGWLKDGDSVDHPYDYKGVHASPSNNYLCYSIRRNSSAPSTRLNCKFGPSYRENYFTYYQEYPRSIITSAMSPNSDYSVLVFSDKMDVLTFEKSWSFLQ